MVEAVGVVDLQGAVERAVLCIHIALTSIVSVNFCHSVFSLLDFLALEAGADKLSQNTVAELPLYAL